MSGAVKRRAAAPPGSHPAPETTKKGVSHNGNAATSPTLTYPAELSDDVNMNEVDGLVSLDVTLPNGQKKDISVDYNTPMLDLLVCLAGKSKLNPSGLTLQLVSEDTGKLMLYKPNQTIGALGGRIVRIVNKDELAKNKASKKEKPFEVTHRFTVNLPRGVKTVVRVSPLMTLGELVATVCQDKGLDLHRHILQIPGKPGVPVDLGATIQQIGVHEMNLIAVGLHDKNHTVSMPDLSRPPPASDQPPSYMPAAGETKKKRGFLSFLSKKEKKFKPENRYNTETSSTTSHMMSSAQARRAASPPPSLQRRGSDIEQPSARPKSMFVQTPVTDENTPKITETNVQSIVAPARKKRRAPAPPVPQPNAQTSSTQLPPSSEISAKKDQVSKDSSSATNNTHNTPAASQREETVTSSVASSQGTRAEMLSRLHSRNSSDSSGYHELTLSGCESPEAAHPGVNKYKTSIDATSIESTDNANGDSGIHESPIRVSPIEEVQERSEVSSVSSGAVQAPQQPTTSSTETLQSKKKRKAPAPPPKTPTSVPSTTDVTEIAITETETTSFVAATQISEKTPEVASEAGSSTSHQEKSEPSQITVSPPEPDLDMKTEMSVAAESNHGDHYISDVGMDINESTAFDINDILEGVVFDEEPKSMELKIVSRVKSEDKDPMMMMETASVTSENIEQVDVTSRQERPCAFIPPPPPTEPPPPEQPEVDIASLTTKSTPVLVDKGTEVNDDNASLAPSSAKSSPGTAHKRRDSFTSLGSIDTIEGISLDFQQAIQLGEESMFSPLDDVEVTTGYKSEMALFVERMSKMAVESTGEGESGQLDDSVSSLSIPGSDNNSDTGSVIHHQRTDSRSGSEAGSLTRKEGMQISGKADLLQHTVEEHAEETSESTGFAVSEEITVHVETLPPPPEFDDETTESEKEIVPVAPEAEEEDEEEYFTETVEEIIIPLGPNGFDFTAAKKVSEVTRSKEDLPESPRETERRGSTGVFRAEPVAIAPVSPTVTPINQSKPKAEPPVAPKPAEKEEFVLTTEDLSNVSFLPPRPKMAKSYPEPEPPMHVSSVSLVMERHDHPAVSYGQKNETSTYNNDRRRVSPQTFTSSTVTENGASGQGKITHLPNLPSMRAHAQSDNGPAFSDDYKSNESSDPLVKKLAPRLLMNSHASSGSSGARKASTEYPDQGINHSHRSSVDNGVDADISTERRGSRASVYSIDAQEQQEALQAQYYSLQAQISQWQEQLAVNQNLLASQAMGPELQSEQLQQLTDQISMQQQMMQQLQSTMRALQQQQLQVQGNGQEHRASCGELPQRIPEPAAAAAEPAPAVVIYPPPPPPAPAPQIKVVKPRSSKPMPKPKSKFEQELTPREELMLAIKGFSRKELRSVPAQQVKWVHSNR